MATQERNRVWVEFDQPKDNEHGHRMAAEGKAFIRKITGVDAELVWDEENNKFEFAWNPMSWETLADNGLWLNLTNLSK